MNRISHDSITHTQPSSALTLPLLLYHQLGALIDSPDFAALLDVRTVLSLAQVSRIFRQVFGPRYLRLVVRLGNLNPELRRSYWTHVAMGEEYAIGGVVHGRTYPKLLDDVESQSGAKENLVQIRRYPTPAHCETVVEMYTRGAPAEGSVNFQIFLSARYPLLGHLTRP